MQKLSKIHSQTIAPSPPPWIRHWLGVFTNSCHCVNSVPQTARLVIRCEQWPVERIPVSLTWLAPFKPDHHTFVNVRVHASVTPMQTKAVSTLVISVSVTFVFCSRTCSSHLESQTHGMGNDPGICPSNFMLGMFYVTSKNYESKIKLISVVYKSVCNLWMFVFILIVVIIIIIMHL